MRRAINYPDDYAGAYIHSENHFHLMLVNNDNIDSYKEMLCNDESVIYEIAKTPRNKLTEIFYSLDEVLLDYGFNGHGLREDVNAVHIDLKDESQKNKILAYLRENIDGLDEDVVYFEVGGEVERTGGEALESANVETQKTEAAPEVSATDAGTPKTAGKSTAVYIISALAMLLLACL